MNDTTVDDIDEVADRAMDLVDAEAANKLGARLAEAHKTAKQGESMIALAALVAGLIDGFPAEDRGMYLLVFMRLVQRMMDD